MCSCDNSCFSFLTRTKQLTKNETQSLSHAVELSVIHPRIHTQKGNKEVCSYRLTDGWSNGHAWLVQLDHKTSTSTQLTLEMIQLHIHLLKLQNSNVKCVTYVTDQPTIWHKWIIMCRPSTGNPSKKTYCNTLATLLSVYWMVHHGDITLAENNWRTNLKILF